MQFIGSQRGLDRVVSGLVAGIVSLGEAGNLGDDLILLAALKALSESRQVSKVIYLTHGEEMPWGRLRDQLALSVELEGRRPLRELPLSRREERLFSDCDLMVFGGGGLLQDVHHPLRPYHWLRYVDPTVPTAAVGLGVGPLTRRWDRWFRAMGSPFSVLYVRDAASRELVEERFGWSCRRSSDFVDLEFVTELMGDKVRCLAAQRNRVLGVAVREWPGLSAATLARHLEQTVAELEMDRVDIFVLEAKSGSGPDVQFSRLLREQLSVPSELHIYRPMDVVGFIDRMWDCAAAVSMKLHSSALWAHGGVPVFPIIYAPKTAALFGLEYRGLEILSSPREISPSWHSEIRSHDALVAWIRSNPGRTDGSLQGRINRGFRVLMQVGSAWTSVVRRIRRR